MRELIETYDEYVALLGSEMESLYGLAFVHGYRCEDERVKRGEELRAKIERLKAKLSQTNT